MLGKAKQLRQFVDESDLPLEIKEALIVAIQLEISGAGNSEFVKLVEKYAVGAENS